jgi:hypothetical protein
MLRYPLLEVLNRLECLGLMLGKGLHNRILLVLFRRLGIALVGSVSIAMSLVTMHMLVRRGIRVSREIMFMVGICRILVPLLLLCVLLKSLDRPFSVYQICHLRVMQERELTLLW